MLLGYSVFSVYKVKNYIHLFWLLNVCFLLLETLRQINNYTKREVVKEHVGEMELYLTLIT